MESWLEWARGPVFTFSIAFMILGLARHLFLVIWEIIRVYYRAGDRKIPFGLILSETSKWLFPFKQMGTQFIFTLTSILFHIAIIIVPLFLTGHIVLWTRGIGLSWPGISNETADILTIVAIITGIALVLQRLTATATRSISRFQDYALPILIVVPFIAGFLMMHPGLNPFSYDAVFFIHIMSANFIFLLIPVTKLSHIVIFPETQIISEMAWHWPADAGSKVGKTLGKENLPV